MGKIQQRSFRVVANILFVCVAEVAVPPASNGIVELLPSSFQVFVGEGIPLDSVLRTESLSEVDNPTAPKAVIATKERRVIEAECFDI